MTTYRLAKGSDYTKCYAFMRRLGLEENRLAYPTVIAEKDDEIVALLGRGQRDEFPRTILYFNLPGINPAFTLIRQLSLYEAALMSIGDFVHFISVDGHDKEWIDILETIGFTILNEEDEQTWMQKVLTDVD